VEEHPLTEQQIDAIATKAAHKALDLVYAEVGKSVLKRLAWIVGVVTLALLMFLAGKGVLPNVTGN
jgi:hypothetical protein